MTQHAGDIVERSRVLSAQAHAGQTMRQTCTPYVVHLGRVALLVELAQLPDEAIATAWLHGILQDGCGDYTDYLRLPQSMRDAVYTMSRRDGETDAEQIGRLSRHGSSIAVAVALADRIDNLMDGRRCLSDAWLDRYLEGSQAIWEIGVRASGCAWLSSQLRDQIDRTQHMLSACPCRET